MTRAQTRRTVNKCCPTTAPSDVIATAAKGNVLSKKRQQRHRQQQHLTSRQQQPSTRKRARRRVIVNKCFRLNVLFVEIAFAEVANALLKKRQPLFTSQQQQHTCRRRRPPRQHIHQQRRPANTKTNVKMRKIAKKCCQSSAPFVGTVFADRASVLSKQQPSRQTQRQQRLHVETSATASTTFPAVRRMASIAIAKTASV